MQMVQKILAVPLLNSQKRVRTCRVFVRRYEGNRWRALHSAPGVSAARRPAGSKTDAADCIRRKNKKSCIVLHP